MTSGFLSAPLRLLNMKPLPQNFSFLVLLLCACLRIDARPADGPPGLPVPSAWITVDSPAGNSEFLTGMPIAIRATAVDPAGAILRAEIFDGDIRIGVSEIATFAPVPAGQPVQHYYLWNGAPAGAHKISVRAKDAAGNGVASPTVLVQVSKPKPASIQILAPKDLQTFSIGEDIAISAEAVDPVGLITAVGFYANGELIGTAVHDPCPPCFDPPCPARPCVLPALGATLMHGITWRVLSEGKFAIEVRGTNLAGAVVVSPAVRIAVVKPLRSSVTFNTPKDGEIFPNPGPVAMEVTTVDPDSEIRRVEFYGDEKLLGVSEILTKDLSIPGRPRQLRFTWTNPPAGGHILVARAKDAASHAVVSAPVTIRSGTPKPASLVIVTPLQGDYVLLGKPVVIDTIGQDPDSLVSTVEFFVDGLRVGESCFLCLAKGVFPPGTPFHNSFAWTPGKPGKHTLTAVAHSGADTLTKSAPVVVEVVSEIPKPKLVITTPASGATVRPDADTKVLAVGVGRYGGITDVELLLDGKHLATSSIRFIRAPGADESVTHAFSVRIPAGSHALTARDLTDPGIVSAPVKVLSEVLKPTLTLTAPATVRADANIQVVAVGVGRAGGILDVELLLDGARIAVSDLVFIRPPGIDEPVKHTFSVRIPAGTHVLTARDLKDKTVVSAPVKVVSTTSPKPATITWVKPADGETFVAGTPVRLGVEAVDPGGLIYHVDFYADGKLIGGSDFSCPTCKFAPGATIPHSFAWTGAAAGKHTLVVKGKDFAGHEVVSKPIVVVVVAPHIVAERVLPTVLPYNSKFTVSITVKPVAGVRNYVVEDHPPFMPRGGAQPLPAPPRWMVSAIGNNGVYDAATGAVKFGPFFDDKVRALTYIVVTDGVAVANATFSGSVVADGVASDIGGATVIHGTIRHPADIAPADDSINASELTAYGAAWKAGKAWPGVSGAIPIDHVTRAGTLWRGGEHYRFDPSAGPAPLWWVSEPLLVPGAKPAGAGRLGQGFRGVALRSVDASSVSLRVLPPPGAAAYAAEERVGVEPSAISDDGTYDAEAGVVRWGPFLDGQARTLTYRTATVSAASAGASVSIDGTGVPVGVLSAAKPSSGLRLAHIAATEDGATQVVVEDDAFNDTSAYELETSSDLRKWTSSGTFVNGTSAGFIRDEAPATDGPRFYRAKRVR